MHLLQLGARGIHDTAVFETHIALKAFDVVYVMTAGNFGTDVLANRMYKLLYLSDNPGGASAVGLTYLGGERVVPYYGGGMSTAKAALQIDAKQLASNLGPKNIRVNLISAGPYASRAARSIRPGEFEKSVEYAAVRSPLPRPIKPEEVANATVFLCSDLASAVTAQILYVDCGYNVMGV